MQLMLQATVCDCLLLDPFAFEEDGLSAFEVDVSRGKIVEALMMAVSRQISIGYLRRRISPSALTIREQKQWDPTEARSARSQYRI